MQLIESLKFDKLTKHISTADIIPLKSKSENFNLLVLGNYMLAKQCSPIKTEISLAKSYNTIAINGPRMISTDTQDKTQLLTKTAIDNDLVILTSGAKGVDTEVLRTVNDDKAKAIVFLANNISFEKSNIKEYQKILNNNGAIVLFDTPTIDTYDPKNPATTNYQRRTRLMNTFADIILNIDSGFPSGTFDQSKEALNNNTPVWAVPGNSGSNELIRAGAKLVATPKHFMIELENFKTSPLNNKVKEIK